MTEVCNACHEEMGGANSKYKHGPFAGGLCMGCHRPHASTSAALLTDTGAALCLGCHEQLAPEGQGDTYWHQPVQEDCAACHHPHGTDHPDSLLEPAQALCLGCHDEIGEKVNGSTVQHKAGAEGETCLGCHLPHASQYSRLLVSESAKLCLSCHDKEYPREKGRPVANIAAEMKEFPNHHGPVREMNCEGCHEPHGSAHFRLLTQEYPARFYAPFDEKNYEFCFACHERDIVRQEKTTVTNFRDGERNLHYLHVKRKKGRTCRACHAVHASNQPHHLRETTPFGKWELPVGYSKTPDGGTCASGCHQELGYARGGGK
jgi:predicted CXXCH cytochrome family protein